MNGANEEIKTLRQLNHDLRNPLNAIIGYSEMLTEVCTDQGWADMQCDLERVNQAAKSLVEFIREYFDPKRVESLSAKRWKEITLAGIDFQLRTSLNVITGYTEMMLEDATDLGREELVTSLQKIHTAAGQFHDEISALKVSSLVAEVPKPEIEQDSTSRGYPETQGIDAYVRRYHRENNPYREGHVLIVEDDPLNRDTLVYYLKQLGHQVEVAENGQQAIQMIDNNGYDLILLDIIMPVMDGFQVLQKIKANSIYRDIPVIIISTLDDHENIARGVRLGAADCLPKPFDPVILEARVDACLERKHWHDQEQEYLAIIKTEREKSERLLQQMLPAPIAERLKNGELIIADSFDEVTILFADLVDFTPLTTMMSPERLVILLNDLFCMFDNLVSQHNLEKIRAIGDEFVVAGGLLKPETKHVEAVADLALAMFISLEGYNKSHNCSIGMRIGMETGPAIAGVIGSTQFSYDLWGDAINTASRMQSCGASGRIHITKKVYTKLKDEYTCEDRGLIAVKGKGEMRTYFLVGRRSKD